MQKIKFRTKVEIFGAIIFVAMLVAVSAAAVTRTITDTSDNSYTFIRNSNGNYWEATGANIQTAINDLGSGGGTVYLPSGTITLTAFIEVGNNVKILGSGVGGTTITAANAFASYMFRVNGKHNATISDLTIDGNDVMGNLIYLTGKSADCTIQNVYLRDSKSNCIYTSGGCERCIFDNIRATGVDGSSYEAFAIADIYDSTFSNLIAWDATMGVDFHNVKNCVISNIEIFDCNYAIKFWGEGDYTTDILVSNINCYDLRSGDNTGGLWIKNVKRSSFTNIHIRNSHGIVIDGSEDINLDNFYIENALGVGLYLDSDIGSNYRININNGIVKNSISDGILIGSAQYITVANCQILNSGNYNYVGNSNHVKISSSRFLDGNSYGLIIADTDYINIIDSEFIGNALDGIDLTIGGGSSYYTISSCTFYDNALAIDCHDTNDDYIIITNNICSGDAIDDHYKTKGFVQNNIGDDI